MIEDAELLRRYAKMRSETAFAELVRRHLTLVYSVALRQVAGDAHLADDVVQTVFTALARKAGQLSRRQVLAGWLYQSTQYAATDAVRSESRRRSREQEAQTMHELITDPNQAADWDRLRPVLDEAISELSGADRDAVCLRFFEERSFAEVGAQLRLTENAARMRVNRALDKLHALLGQRGITSTTAAPAGLAASLTSAVIATPTLAAGGLAAGSTIFTLMSTSKITLGVAGLLAVAAGGVAWHQTNELHETKSRLADTRARETELLDRVHALETRVENQTQSTQAAEEDIGRLLTAIEENALLEKQRAGTVEGPLTPDQVRKRFDLAKQMARNGQFEQALDEFVWCYDEGMVRVSGFAGVRSSYLLTSIAELAQSYPPALAFLRGRRDTAEESLRTNSSNSDAAMAYQSLNRTLNEEYRTLQCYDQLSADDPGKRFMTLLVYDQLREAQRYTEAAKAKSLTAMTFMFEQTTQLASRAGKGDERNASNILTAAEGVEVFAGSGQLADAATLVQKVLSFDRSPETISVLRQHAARAGHPELVVLPADQ